MIRLATRADSERIAAIYNHYIDNSTITFEEERVCAEQISTRIREVLTVPLPWLVYESSEEIRGYAYATRWRTRSAYRFSVEVSVYVEPNSVGEGLGSKLYDALFTALRQQGVHVVIGGITLPNPASVALHEKFGLKKVAHFEEVGFKFGRWLDVGYWQTTF